MDKDEAISQLEDSREKIEGALDEIEEVIKEFMGPRSSALERAKTYWLSHVKGAIRKRSMVAGGSFLTMDDTIDEIRKEGP